MYAHKNLTINKYVHLDFNQSRKNYILRELVIIQNILDAIWD